MEYVNEKFKEMLRINGEILPSDTDENGAELLKVILNLETFEEQTQYNDNMDDSEEDNNKLSRVSLHDSSALSNSKLKLDDNKELSRNILQFSGQSIDEMLPEQEQFNKVIPTKPSRDAPMETPVENVGLNKLYSINMLLNHSNIILQKKVFKLVRPKSFNIIKIDQIDN
jgi:hypothetical protein